MVLVLFSILQPVSVWVYSAAFWWVTASALPSAVLGIDSRRCLNYSLCTVGDRESAQCCQLVPRTCGVRFALSFNVWVCSDLCLEVCLLFLPCPSKMGRTVLKPWSVPAGALPLAGPISLLFSYRPCPASQSAGVWRTRMEP